MLEEGNTKDSNEKRRHILSHKLIYFIHLFLNRDDRSRLQLSVHIAEPVFPVKPLLMAQRNFRGSYDNNKCVIFCGTNDTA